VIINRLRLGHCRPDSFVSDVRWWPTSLWILRTSTYS